MDIPTAKRSGAVSVAPSFCLLLFLDNLWAEAVRRLFLFDLLETAQLFAKMGVVLVVVAPGDSFKDIGSVHGTTSKS
jgi:hypothetical protein